MRILIISQYYYPELNSVNYIAEELSKRGHEVGVITGKPNYGFKKILPEYRKIKKEIINGVTVHRINLKPRKDTRFSVYENYLSFYFNSRRFVSKFNKRFDIVLSFSLSPVISISAAIKYSKKFGVPHLLFCEDLWPESTVVTRAVKMNSLTYKLLYKWSKSLYSKCNDIVISSPSFREYFYDVLNIKDKSFEYINQPPLKSKNEKIEPHVYSKKHNFVYAGNIGKLQLVDNLISAIKLTDENTVLHLMGMGSNLNDVLKRIKDENLEDKVYYHGALKIEEAEKYYINADALIVSLKNDGYVGKTIPNKAIQYLKYGRPILGVIDGDAKKMLINAKGSVFASENIFDIAKAMNDISLMNVNEKDILGNNNLVYFNNNFTIDKIVDKLEHKLRSMIKNS